MSGSTHYSKSLEPALMITWAIEKAKYIASLNEGYPILIYSGMSGVSYASYLASALFKLKIESGQIYIRKDGEKSHGQRAEYSYNVPSWINEEKFILIFVDDFVQRGDTLIHCLEVTNLMTHLKSKIGKAKLFLHYKLLKDIGACLLDST